VVNLEIELLGADTLH